MRKSGSVIQRGKSYRIKFEIERDPVTGARRTQFITFRGTKREANAELAKRLSEVAEGEYVTRSPATVAEYAKHWIEAIAPSNASAKTRERYRELIDHHIVPKLGNVPLQKLDGTKIDAFYAHLNEHGRRDGAGGLAPQTVLHIHRLLSQILASAVKAQKLRSSPMAAVQTTPKAPDRDIQILDDKQLATLYRHLKGRPLYMAVVQAANTGMRRGEVLALRWQDIDFDAGALQVAQVVEKTRKSIALKQPKTKTSRRAISLGPTLLQELRDHRRAQAEWRLKLGIGKGAHDLVFPAWEGGLRNPEHFTKEFGREVVAAGLPHVTFHGLRHTHITHLLRSGVPVHIVSARAGHANPSITLNIYSHKLKGDQDRAASIVDDALKAALRE